MEAMRTRFSTQMIPLGNKNRGIVQENLGQTSFKEAVKARCPSPSTPQKRFKSTPDSSDDDLDLLSQPSPQPTSSLDKLQSNASVASGSPSKTSLSKRPKPKPKPRLKPDKTPLSPLHKARYDSSEMPPSNQLAIKAKHSQSRDEQCKSIKLKMEIQDFPMDVEVVKSSIFGSSKHSTTKDDLSPFPISPKAKTLRAKKNPELAPFPMKLPQERNHPSRKSQDHPSMESSELSLRPFPMPMPAIGELVVKDPPMPMQIETIMSPDLPTTNNVDPSKLCPYCDELMPEEPSPTLLGLLAKVKRKSRKDPRPGNPLGLMATLGLFAEVCERHRLEMNYLPLAISRGWPRKIDFTAIPDRIQGFEDSLKALIISPESSSFWKDLRNEMAVVGRKKFASVSGQFATFEKSQPGYYGEQGSVIIQQTLYSLFPSESVSEEAIDPLSVDQFLSQVLLPEAAALLIMQDMRLSSKQQALGVLEESKRYGIAMFPERAQSNAVSEIGERLARERALSRRKYLKEIGETEEDMAAEIENEKPKKASLRTRKAAIHSSTDSDSDSSHRQRSLARKVSRQTPKPKRWDSTKKDMQASTSNKVITDSARPAPSGDVPWTRNLREHKLREKNSDSESYARVDESDATPKPRTKSKSFRSVASERSDTEIVSKPRPKPKSVKRNLKHEMSAGEEGVLASMDATKENSSDWLLDS